MISLDKYLKNFILKNGKKTKLPMNSLTKARKKGSRPVNFPLMMTKEKPQIIETKKSSNIFNPLEILK